MPITATSPEQRLRETLRTLLDAHASMVAVTGYASKNVVPEFGAKSPQVPRLMYRIVSLRESDVILGNFDAQLTFTAVAATPEKVNALLDLVDSSLATCLLTPAALAALSPAMDGIVIPESVVRSDPAPDPTAAVPEAETVLAVLDCLLVFDSSVS